MRGDKVNDCTVMTSFGGVNVVEDESGVVFEADFESKAFLIGNSGRKVKFFTRRIPKLYDEITQNGHTFEVQGTRITETGKLQVENEQGIWEDYQ